MAKTKKVIDFDYDYSMNSEPSTYGTPERNLLMSMLERAILDYVGNDPKDIMEAEKWIFGTSANEDDLDDFYPFSFNWTCKELDLDPKFVSSIIKEMPKRGKHRVAPWYFNKKQKI